MNLKKGQIAPEFVSNDAFGKSIRLSDYRGKKIFLAFFRVVGCPTCNFTFHEIQKRAASLQAQGMVFLAVYASSPEMMRTYLEMAGESKNIYGTLIGDPEGFLYQKYGVESSVGKLLSGLLFKGTFSKFTRGSKLFPKKLKDEGHLTLLGAEFLIDEEGRITKAHYAEFSGDFIDSTKWLVSQVPHNGRLFGQVLKKFLRYCSHFGAC